MNVYTIGFGFMEPFIKPYCTLIDDPLLADFILTMNNASISIIQEACAVAEVYNKPLCYWCIEDPNSHLAFLPQAKLADYVFTSDKACIPSYRAACGHDRIFWLPLAACEKLHYPMPLADDAADFVFSGNWYDSQWEARRWGSEVLILPLAEAGYSMAIFSYDEPPYEILKPFWRGGTSCYTSAEQYTHGRIVLGNNNQRSGMDGRGITFMTSMRTFEVLACGKPFLAPHSDAYEALGLEDRWQLAVTETPQQTLDWARHLLDIADTTPGNGGLSEAAIAMADYGRKRVLEHHTYRHRLEMIMEAIG